MKKKENEVGVSVQEQQKEVCTSHQRAYGFDDGVGVGRSVPGATKRVVGWPWTRHKEYRSIWLVHWWDWMLGLKGSLGQ